MLEEFDLGDIDAYILHSKNLLRKSHPFNCYELQRSY
jgi:hypothetical protein